MDKQEKRSLKKKLEEEVEASLQRSPQQSLPRPVSQWDEEPLPAHYKEPPSEPKSPEPLSLQGIHTTEDGLDVIEHQGSFKLNNQTGFEEEYCEPEKPENSIFGPGTAQTPFNTPCITAEPALTLVSHLSFNPEPM